MFQTEYDIVPDVESVEPTYNIFNITKQFKIRSFISEVFPYYPLDITLIPKADDSINKLQIVVSSGMCPERILVMVSDDLDGKYDTIGQIKFEETYSKKQITKTLRMKQFNKQFIKIRIMGALETQDNISKQIQILALKLYNQRFQNTTYLYNINTCKEYPKHIRSILESLEYRLKHMLKQKNYDECQILNNLIKRTTKQVNQLQNKNSKSAIQSNLLLKEIQTKYLIKSIAQQFPQDVPSIRRPSMRKQQELIPRKNNRIVEIFEHYIERITPYYLDLIGSPQEKHNQKAILDLWNLIKHQYQMPLIDQQMIFDLTIYFLQSPNNDTVNVMLQVFRAFLTKQYTKNAAPSLCNKVLLLVCQDYESKKDMVGSSVWQSTIVQMFNIIKPDEYFDIILNTKHISDSKKVEILYLLLKTERIDNYHNIVSFLKQLFSNTGSSAKELASSKITLEALLDILQEQLPTNIMVPLRKQMNLKLQASIRRKSIPISTKQAFCQYCFVHDSSFSEIDAMNIHCFRDCIYLTKCKECQQIVQIPKLVQHQLEQCQNRNVYIKCQKCGLAVRNKETNIHKNSCPEKISIYCPLCLQNCQNVQNLQKHIRSKKCPRNPRN